MGEFELIERYFKRPARSASRAVLGLGDDCALLAPAPGMQLAISSDMLVEGRHFLSTVDPARLGHKALAVNLSDLAACGARPLAFTLALALPRADANWLSGFSSGLFALADHHQIELVGGDTTQGPLNICITVLGEVPGAGNQHQALLRSGAQVGDDLYVSGHLGDARLALDVFRGNVSLAAPLFELARARMEQPTPRVALGLALRGIASAAIDVSDGVLGDLNHLLQASQVGAVIDTAAAQDLLAVAAHPDWAAQRLDTEKQLGYVLAGGDDYELVFSAPAAAASAVQQAALASATPVTRIGHVRAEAGIALLDAQGRELPHTYASFDHFKA